VYNVNLESFLTSIGRRKFIAALYADLAKTDWGKKTTMSKRCD